MKVKYYLSVIMSILLVCLLCVGCSKNITTSGADNNQNDTTNGNDNQPPIDNNPPTNTQRISIKVGNTVFIAQLYDNQTVDAFVQLLPMTVNMSDMPHEKYCYLSQTLPTNPQQVNQINTGDLMLWGNNCFVLFYESFSTSYSYTKLGRIVDVTNLATIVGANNISVTIEVLP